ncbi:MAG: ABC transporter ATP-binding protein, partial [Thermoplasmata archaeon]
MNDTADPLVRLESISKTFGRVKANRDITLHIRAGKVKALLGENGAGKSTLMSILSGRLKPD